MTFFIFSYHYIPPLDFLEIMDGNQYFMCKCQPHPQSQIDNHKEDEPAVTTQTHASLDSQPSATICKESRVFFILAQYIPNVIHKENGINTPEINLIF